MIQDVKVVNIKCDNCKKLWSNDFFPIAWIDANTVEAQIEKEGWVTDKNNHYCPDCKNK